MYKDVIDMNEAFGNFSGDRLNPNWEALSNQSKNILDEYNELFDDGINPKNMKEFRDAICDILVFTMGAAHMSGMDLEADMKMVFDSNMSKFCATQEIVDATVAKYEALGVEVYVDGEFPRKRVKSAKQQYDNDEKLPKLYQANKMLKSVSFKPPVFEDYRPDFSHQAYDI